MEETRKKSNKKDVALFFVAKTIVGLIGVVLISLYSKKLSASEYGQYSLISGLISALSSVIVGWIGSAALRYYIDYKDHEEKRFITNTILYTLLATIFVCALTLLIGGLSDKIEIRRYVFSSLLYATCFSFFEVIEKTLRACGKTKIYAIATIIQSIVSLTLFVLITHIVDDANSILLSTSLARLIFITIAFCVLRVMCRINPRLLDLSMLKKFLKYGIPMIGVWGMTWLLGYCDRYIIALYNNSSEVGLYDMSYKVAENSVNVIISAFTLAIFPVLIRTWKKYGKKATEEQIRNTINYYNMLVMPAICGLSLLTKDLYGTFISNSYSEGSTIILIVAIGMYFNGLNSIINKAWQLKEKTSRIFYIMLFATMLNILLNLLLIPKFGINVAAITTLLSYVCSTIITAALIRKDMKIEIDKYSLLKTLVSVMLMGVSILLVDAFRVSGMYAIVLKIILGIIVYAILTIVFDNMDCRKKIMERMNKCTKK